jgi:hypothetical protein
MEKNIPPKILCPTRGGQASYPNQDGAVRIARERGIGIDFLYISNVEFLDLTSGPKLVDLQHEMDELGEFLLVMAQEHASQAGIKAGGIVRQGDFRSTLFQVLQDGSYQVLILGSPKEKTGITESDYLDELSQEISKEFDVEVILLHEGEIIKSFQSKSAPSRDDH